MTASHSFSYYLMPRREGEFELPPIGVVVDGQRYQSAPLRLRVLPANSAPAPDTRRDEPPTSRGDEAPDYFVTMTTDRDSVVVGEQVILTFSFYRSQFSGLFESPEYTAPTTEGFWREDLSPVQRRTQIVRSRRYDVSQVRYALFPTRAGELTIGEAVVRIPADIFGSMLRRRPGRREDEFLRAPAIPVYVRPLPAGAPADFNGTVASDLELRASVDRQELAVGEALTLKLVLEGDGFLARAASPELPPLSGFRVHDSGSGLDSRPLDDTLHGRLSVDKLLIAQEAGDYTLPPVEYVYYDSARKRYRRLSTQAISLTVTPSSQNTSSLFAGGGRSEIELLSQDIRHIQPLSATLNAQSGPLTQKVGYWAMLATPLLLFAGSTVLHRRRERALADPARQRRRRARRIALQRLQESRGSSAGLDEALRGYLADHLDREAAGLTQPLIADALRREGVAGATVDDCLRLLDRCDRLRFAGGADDAAALAGELQQLIERIEKEAGGA